jgi:Uncharacterized protein conserved in bacteria
LIAFFILGVAIALQIRSTLYTKKLNASKVLSVETVVSQISAEQKTVDQLKAEIDDNLLKRDQLVKDYFEENKDYESGEEWKQTMLKAGFTEVKGPGITIKLDDAAARQEDTPLNWLIIHDQDIKILLNELKSSGAQAIAINGERITAISEQVCAGPTILINGNRYSVPYKIEAIGDPELLYADISKCPKIAEMTEYKIRVDITKSKEITIPKFSGITQIDRFISGMKEIKK